MNKEIPVCATQYMILVVDENQIVVKALNFHLKPGDFEQLRAVNESWIITKLELECSICKGSGKAKSGKGTCQDCNGIGRKSIGGAKA